ncbi:MAG: phenylalanine--tRNA ligase subunit beta [Eubacteriales bacterium]|nr:phenylalanine--tRNA ligase subunit beta [Eubacteriales bacterium]
MKLSREWLDELTHITVSDKEYCDRMTMSGSKVEGVEVTGDDISGVVVGRVLEMTRHPNSDHLWICQVDVGGKQLQIVTGAQNVLVGDLVPAALDGAELPGGVSIRAGVLRGEESAGMLCSVQELGLDIRDFPQAAENGIFILYREGDENKELADAVPGQDIHETLGLGDSVVEFEITNNRPDCLSVIGLARESAVTFGTELTLHTPQIKGGVDDINDMLTVQIDDSYLCPRYTAKMVKNIHIAPSPLWMRRRLRAAGVRPINNIVDITNYVMLEYGQPMHAFDYACVGGKKIVVRRAAAGETLQTLDGNERAITPDMLVIADAEKPIGLAGVMGGFNSEITENTNMIVFESANFNGTSVRKTSIALGMRTDASGRFEKGLDPMGTVPAVERACELVELLGAGEVVRGTIDVVAAEPVKNCVTLDPDRINGLLGTNIDRDFMEKTLKSLGFVLDGDTIISPSWRSDVEGFADIAEEVARFYGYDVIEPSLMSGSTAEGGYTDRQNFERDLGALCRGMGFFEIITYSFGSRTAWDRIRLPEDSPLRNAYVIQNPLGEDSSVMRTTSLPSMLDSLGTNAAKRNTDVRLYELATIYLPQEGQILADERSILTLGLAGGGTDFFTVKGCVEAILRGLRIPGVRFTADHNNPSYHPGRCASITVNGVRLGVMGQVHPKVCEAYGLEGDVFTAELDIREMFALRAPEPVYTPLPRYPSISRDLAVVCDKEIAVADLTDTIMAAGGTILRDCRLFDVYTGAPIPAGKRSLAFSLTLRADDQTLTDDHAEETMKNILSSLEEKYGAVIR